MSDPKTISINIHYGGVTEIKDNKFNYLGGLVKKGIFIDPDYITWCMFSNFCKDNHINNEVEQVWFKLSNEEIGTSRAIHEEKDGGIRQMCEDAKKTGEDDVYIENGIDGLGEKNGNDDSDSEIEHGEGGKEGETVEVGEDDVLPEVQSDAMFDAFYEEIRVLDSERELEAIGGKDNCDVHTHSDPSASVEQELEFERQFKDADRPEPVVDTDDEWDDFNREEKEKSRESYEKDKAPYLWLLQTFDSGDDFKDQLLRYVLKTNFDVKLCRWEHIKLAALCVEKECKWRIYCSFEKAKRKWMVKVYDDCHNHVKSSKARMLKQGVVARLFKGEARRRPEIKWTDIKDEIMIRYTLSVSKWICHKVRRVALKFVIETQKQQFAKLWDYEAELRRSNENTTTEIVSIPQADGTLCFDKFYICFESLRNTWKRCCRPIIGIDGAFLKWELKGEILAAVGRDADNRIYPIAWAVVRVEDNDFWAWFVEKLKIDLQLGLGSGFTIISDKQKGLINAVEDILPNVEHRDCARHIYANWSKVYKGDKYEDFFWTISYSYTQGDHTYNLNALKEFDKEAHDDLVKTRTSSWCRAYFSNQARCDDVCNNLSESFNRTIKDARKFPIIHMLEEVRKLAMTQISMRRNKIAKCITTFPPNIMEIYEENRKVNKFCEVLKSCHSQFEVHEHENAYLVCLPNRHMLATIGTSQEFLVDTQLKS